uniref:Uncharacterized protein n=1 Tax=Aegilops tauschii subsp. strangulata TaxID=200361 RepID=A0A453SFJ7_AEGTS
GGGGLRAGRLPRRPRPRRHRHGALRHPRPLLALPRQADGPPPRLLRRFRRHVAVSQKRKREKARRGSMKRVRFAADVVEHGPARPAPEEEEAAAAPEPSCRGAAMPANREALYRGMLRGRSMLRTACSY